MNKIKYYGKLLGSGIINSYSQIYFSKKRYFGLLLMFVTFLNFESGLMGVVSILSIQFVAISLNFSHNYIRDGVYSYNALMVGLALGTFYQLNISLILINIAISILGFMICLWFINNLSKKNLPILSIPFLISIWIVILGANNFTALDINRKHLEIFQLLSPYIYTLPTEVISHLPFANVIYLYLRSLGAILFQYNDLAGLIIVVGLLLNSRISFVLSLFGFAIGYIFYSFMEGDFSQLVYSYIGFNFVLTSIALGGFFVVPSWRSFGQLIIIIPMIALIISASHNFFSQLGLPIYSLPFNIVVLLFLTGLMLRNKEDKLNLVKIQQYSAEKHLYNYLNSKERFSAHTPIHISLPFLGEWRVSQAYDGEITHKGDWKEALDFDIIDDNNSTFQLPGYNNENYYCYDVPVLAPASGTIIQILDAIPDNEIGKVNLENNWGNTIIIKHSDYLYSKLSHLKKYSINVKIGDYVSRGEVVAKSGSSGRSPEPHLHFQMQATPYIGSKTIPYPVSYYVTREDNNIILHSFEIPQKHDKISNLQITPLLKEAFYLIPGRKIKARLFNNSDNLEAKKSKLLLAEENWEIFTNHLNETFIWCETTNSSAWFINNGNVFYFTGFKGNKKSLLYQFYLSLYKIPLAYYRNLELKDKMNILSVSRPFFRFFYDFTAPFFKYLSIDYNLKFNSADDDLKPQNIKLQTIIKTKLFGKIKTSDEYNIIINKETFEILNSKKQIICELL